MRDLVRLYLDYYRKPKIKVFFFLFVTVLLSSLEVIVMGLLYTFTKHINNESINKFIVLFFKFINKYILIDISILIIILLVSFFFFRLITQTISSWWRSLFVWDIYNYF